MKNQFNLIGNVGQKPELKVSKNGNKYLSFSIAVTERYKDRETQEQKEITNWFNLVVYDKRAEGLAKILDKGKAVAVSGKLKVVSEDVDGKKHKKVELVVQDVQVMSGSKREESSED